MLLYVHKKTVDLLGTGAQDGHLDFHTAPELPTDGTQLQTTYYAVSAVRENVGTSGLDWSVITWRWEGENEGRRLGDYL